MLANAFTKSLLQLGWLNMKSTQRFSLAFSFLVAVLMFGGCTSSNCGSNSGNGLFGTNILQNQPIRTTVRSWFQGDSCDTCNTPAGQLTQPVCENCIGGGVQGFSNGQLGGSQTQPLYGAPTVNGAQPGQFAPQPGPAVGSTSRSVDNNLGSGTSGSGTVGSGNFGSLATPPAL